MQEKVIIGDRCAEIKSITTHRNYTPKEIGVSFGDLQTAWANNVLVRLTGEYKGSYWIKQFKLRADENDNSLCLVDLIGGDGEQLTIEIELHG